MRSSTENIGCLFWLCITATISRSNMTDARRMISRWPKVTGSKLPG